jgi:hypothetical protein
MRFEIIGLFANEQKQKPNLFRPGSLYLTSKI